MEQRFIKTYTKYVSMNILGMVGISCYILADTYFVSKALGSTGLASLNFSIPIFSFISGIGLMIGIGGGTRYSILKSRKENSRANGLFSTCIKLGLFFGFIFLFMGLMFSKTLAKTLGADASTLQMTTTYIKTIFMFAPFFILNNLFQSFIRNDENPRLSMSAMLVGSLMNILLDYLFMFPLGLGIFGAAFATGLSPVISILILSTHFIKRKNGFRFIRSKVKLSTMIDVSSLGLASLITEVASAIVLITFNLVILRIEGNIGVAAYGIVANIALVGIAIFNGIGQGIQPLISREHGIHNRRGVKRILHYALFTSLFISLMMYLSLYFSASQIVELFNNEKNFTIEEIATKGLRIYFIGFFFASMNIILSMYLSATEHAKPAFLISLLRGCFIIIPFVFILSLFFKMTGVWLSFVLTEAFVASIGFVFMVINEKKKQL